MRETVEYAEHGIAPHRTAPHGIAWEEDDGHARGHGIGDLPARVRRRRSSSRSKTNGQAGLLLFPLLQSALSVRSHLACPVSGSGSRRTARGGHEAYHDYCRDRARSGASPCTSIIIVCLMAPQPTPDQTQPVTITLTLNQARGSLSDAPEPDVWSGGRLHCGGDINPQRRGR